MARDEPRVLREIDEVLGEVETLLKTNDASVELSKRGVNVSLAMTALTGLRSYIAGDKSGAIQDLGTAFEEIVARASIPE